MPHSVHVIGAGRHALVTAEIIQLLGHQVYGLLDDNPSLHGASFMNIPVLGSVETVATLNIDKLMLGIGDNQIRQIISTELASLAADSWLSAIHPTAVISPSSSVGFGTLINAGAILDTACSIGSHCIINTAAIISHDCEIGDFVHIAPGGNLAGSVTVEEGAFVGIGATVIQGCTIGAWSTVGAGATVIRDVPAHTTVVGTPAHPINKH